MNDPAFREQQWEYRYALHIAPVNECIDELREGRSRLGAVGPPIHGGDICSG